MELARTFDTVPELYDRARPRYPAALYDYLARESGLQPGARILEIAPATGIATVELAARGYHVTAVEMGEHLAPVARRNLEPFPNAQVHLSRFEDWVTQGEPFDLICCATAFSWLDPAVRLEKCASLLRPGGYLAVWDTLHVAGGTGEFFAEVQACYERWMPGTEPGIRLEETSEIPAETYGIESHPAFELVGLTDFGLALRYSRQEYLDLIGTYSGHIALDEANRSELYRCIGGLIDGRYGGLIEKAYAFRLLLARRRG
jgi:SAM-dependent methyltransferase